MQEALFARWHHLGGVSVVRVRAEGGWTLVQVGAIEREINLQGRRGEEAARIVAVMALDLAQAAAPFPVPTPTDASVSASPGARSAVPIKGRHAFRAGVLLHSPFDQSGLVAHLEPTLDGRWEVAPGFGLFLTAGYRQASSADGSNALVLRELPVARR